MLHFVWVRNKRYCTAILAGQSAYELQAVECVETGEDLAASTQLGKSTLKRNGYGAYTILFKPSGHYTSMCHQFNIQNSTFCPHTVFMCFVWISEQTAIISLYSINWLVFITETECVYCAVRTGSLNTTESYTGCISAIRIR